MGMKTIYVAGPMRRYKDFNFPAFDRARDLLLAQGWNVISPADLDRARGIEGIGMSGFEEFPQEQIEEFVREDIDSVIKASAIYLLRGWENSHGARAEKAVAEWLGREIIFEEETPKTPDYQAKKVKEALVAFIETTKKTQENPPDKFGIDYARGWEQGIDTIIQRAPTLEWAVLDAVKSTQQGYFWLSV